MRLFTAVDPTPEIVDKLADLLNRLRPSAGLRWGRAENLHLTLKFIGEFPAERLSALEETLRAVPAPSPFEVAVRRLGFFPHARAPRVFWAGVEAPAGLAQLAGDIDRTLEPLGIARDRRAYSPHFTLARIADRPPLDALHRAVEALPSLEFGSFRPDRFYLYESRPGPGGSVYTRIEEFPWA